MEQEDIANKRRIIICSDGTWNNPEQKNVTNVVRTALAILPVDRRGIPQLVFYDWDVGSEGVGNKVAGGVLGRGIDKNIQDAYRFIVTSTPMETKSTYSGSVEARTPLAVPQA